jgi:hypothetical protein
VGKEARRKKSHTQGRAGTSTDQTKPALSPGAPSTCLAEVSLHNPHPISSIASHPG